MDQPQFQPRLRRKRRKLNVAAPPATCWVPEQAQEPPSRHKPDLRKISKASSK